MQGTPTHVAIIMDGNRRWAKERGLAPIIGHREGIKSIEKVLDAAHKVGVKVLTLYTFSTENWKRPKREIDALLRLLEEYLDREYKRLMSNNIRLNTIGDIERFGDRLVRKIANVRDMTKANDGLTLNLALNYGGRDEIIRAVRKIAQEALKGTIGIDDISEELFSRHLFTGSLPDPDLLIRTGGEFRISNFLLWQISYSELYVTKKCWPDFGAKDFEKAIDSYMQRERRHGG